MKKRLAIIGLILGFLLLATMIGSVSALSESDCSGWCSGIGSDEDFSTVARYGNQISPNQTWELGIWDKTPTTVLMAQDEFVWSQGQWENFQLSYNTNGTVLWTVDSKTLSWNNDPGKAFGALAVMVKGKTGNNVGVKGLRFNGNLLGDSSINSIDDLRGLLVNLTDADQMSGFTLSGQVNLSWDSNAQNEKPALEIYAINPHNPTCRVLLLSPQENNSYDPLWINWTYEGNCIPSTYTLQYGPDCNGIIWNNIDTVHSSAIPMSYYWDPPSQNPPVESGNYCIRVRMDQAQGIHVSGYSGMIHLDLAPPYVNISSVSSPNVGQCQDGLGECYVSQSSHIGLTCHDDNPDESWQSGPDYIQYRYNINGGAFTSWINYSSPFSFSQDSNHTLEYKCFDKVGKESPTKEKDFIVDSVAPVFNQKTIGEPSYTNCTDGIGVENFDGNMSSCDTYVNQSTQLCVSAYDPAPHPSGDVQITCNTKYWNGMYLVDSVDGGSWNPVELDEQGCFSYSEDSYHKLHCVAEDALGNSADFYEFDIVDSQAPETSLYFIGPYYSNEASQWIDSVSEVGLNATDPQPHPVGVNETYYRYGLADDSYCYGTNESSLNENSVNWQTNWTKYSDPFSLSESCHVIEYYSKDKLGNTEKVNQEFVFSDQTPPILNKSVGNPNHECTPADVSSGTCDPNWDWKITMDTPITLSCNDSQPHPSGVNELCYKVTLDGDVMNSSYSGYQMGGGVFNETSGYYCVPSSNVQIYFGEESEHKLDFYCVDNVDKVSQVDSEVFKVEGTDFNITLDKKWNLISVPFNLLSNNISEVFGPNEDKITGIWGYDPETGWHLYAPGVTENDLTTIDPGHGYWVKTNNATSVLIGGSLLNPGVVPSSVQLDKGWNLIGQYGTASKNAYCSLFSLVDTTIGFPRWSSLYGFNSPTQQFMPLSAFNSMYPGDGYWIEMDVNDTYSPTTVCWGGP